MSMLINIPEIDSTDSKTMRLIHKLSKQAVSVLSQNLQQNQDLLKIIRQSKQLITGRIWEQMKAHFSVGELEYDGVNVLPFTKIEPWHFSVKLEDGYKSFKENITPLSHVTKYVYRGFQKSCHPEYKFDSNTEKVFSQVLESDDTVEKWLCPAGNQFRIFYDHNKHRYYPDFVVEREEAIYLCEVTASKEINTEKVQKKKNAAEIYCHHATAYNDKHGKKPWKYQIFSDEYLKSEDINSTFDGLLQKNRLYC